MIQKILIIGEAGRGKSLMAKNLSDKLGIPHYSTDDFFYEVKFSKIREKQASIEQISKIYKNDKWIVEGTTIHLMEPGLTTADLVIYLKHKNIFSQWLILVKRNFQRKDESVRGLLQLMKHTFYKRYKLGYKKVKITQDELIEPYMSKVVQLHSFKEINNFISDFPET